MKTSFRGFLIFAYVIALNTVFSQAAGTLANTSLNSLDDEARQLIKEISGSDSITAGQIQRRDAYMARGSLAIPPLIRLFNEDKDDLHRWTVLFLLSMAKGSKTEAIQLVESEIAKDPEGWADHKWLGAALNLLSQTDKIKARKACVRILEEGEGSRALYMATSMLEREGEPEDIAALEHLIQRRKNVILAKGQVQDGVSFGANAAIKKIRERALAAVPAGTPTIVATQATAGVNAPVSVAHGPAAPSVTETPSTRSLWPWGLGGALLLALLVFLFGKRR